MGFEALRVELRGSKAGHREADEVIRTIPHVQPDPASVPFRESTYYLFDDGQHAIELELMGSPVRLSCRFTLCHPPSVGSAFLGLVRVLMLRLGMEVRICDDVHPEEARPFALERFDEFSAIATGCIAARRAEWIAEFGDQPLAATTNEVHQRIILPCCQPGIEHPT